VEREYFKANPDPKPIFAFSRYARLLIAEGWGQVLLFNGMGIIGTVKVQVKKG
jgi:hypothetical protein